MIKVSDLNTVNRYHDGIAIIKIVRLRSDERRTESVESRPRASTGYRFYSFLMKGRSDDVEAELAVADQYTTGTLRPVWP
jgi:hypothetical protein